MLAAWVSAVAVLSDIMLGLFRAFAGKQFCPFNCQVA